MQPNSALFVGFDEFVRLRKILGQIKRQKIRGPGKELFISMHYCSMMKKIGSHSFRKKKMKN